MKQQNSDFQKTEITDRLVLLSHLAYQLDEDKNIVNAELRKLKSNKDYGIHLQDIEIQDYNNDMFFAVDSKKKHCYFVARGTIITNMEDLENDCEILISNIPFDRLKNFVMFFDNIYENIQQKYVNYKYYATGHSLGGSLAEYLTLLRDQITGCESFNAGASFAEAFARYIEINLAHKHLHINNPNAKKIVAYHIKADPISLIAVTKESTRVSIDLQFGNFFNLKAHSLDNFLFLIDVASQSIINLHKQKQIDDFDQHFVNHNCDTCGIMLTKLEYQFCIQFEKREYQCQKHHTGICIKCKKFTLDKEFAQVEFQPPKFMHLECKICDKCSQPIGNKEKYQMINDSIEHLDCWRSFAKIKITK